MERRLLAERAANAPRVTYTDSAPEWTVFNTLQTNGRIYQVLVEPTLERAYITDFGRLALRVCPVEE